MKTYEVKYEITDKKSGEITHRVLYVESPDFLTVAEDAAQEAENYKYELLSIRYVLNIVKRLDKPKNTT